jgi:hypothetical protein
MSIRHILFVGLVLVAANAAVVANAADQPPATPSPQTATSPVVAAPEAGAPVFADIPENQAELAAAQAEGRLPAAAPDDAARAALRAELEGLLAVRQARVQALAAQLAGATGEDAAALQRQIEQEKIAGDRELLQWQLDRATAAGDAARVRTLEAALAAWDAPRPAATPVDRPVPAIQAR